MRAGSRILVIDDEEDLRDAVRDLLQACLPDARVETAASGAEALDFLAGHDVDLLITDYKMPGMDGLEFLRRARAFAPGVPHILLTAFHREAMRELDASSRGTMLHKPFAPEELLGLVEETLG